jgi:hypothetical protein
VLGHKISFSHGFYANCRCLSPHKSDPTRRPGASPPPTAGGLTPRRRSPRRVRQDLPPPVGPGAGAGSRLGGLWVGCGLFFDTRKRKAPTRGQARHAARRPPPLSSSRASLRRGHARTREDDAEGAELALAGPQGAARQHLRGKTGARGSRTGHTKRRRDKKQKKNGAGVMGGRASAPATRRRRRGGGKAALFCCCCCFWTQQKARRPSLLLTQQTQSATPPLPPPPPEDTPPSLGGGALKKSAVPKAPTPPPGPSTRQALGGAKVQPAFQA